MTMDLVSGLPFQAGSAVAAAGKRAVAGAAGWYLRAPLRNSALTLMVSLSAMAASNALYGQQHHHPAPMFGSFSDAPADTTPVAMPKPVKAPAKARVVAQPTTLSQDTTPISPKSLGSDEMIAVQQKLQALNLFTATVDGFYGPRTAKAIRAFEEMMGRKPTGQLTREIIDLIKATPANASAMSVAPAPAAMPVKVAPDGTPVKVISPMTPLENDQADMTEETAAPDMALQQTDASPQVELAPAAQQQIAAPTSPALALAEPTEDALSKPLPAPAPLRVGGSNDAPPSTATQALALQQTATDEAAEPEASPALALAAQPATDDAAPVDPQTTAAIPAGAEDLPPVQANGVVKRTVQTISVRAQMPAATAPAEQTDVASLTVDPRTANTNTRVIAAVQRGLSQLGFLHTEVTGVADEATAKAIRNFEVYFNYDVTGRITPDLVKLLAQNGADL